MSYSYSCYVEDQKRFLARLLEIDVEELLNNEIAKRLKEKNLGVERVETISEEDPDKILERMVLSDGRSFQHRLVKSHGGCNWGTQTFLFVDESTTVEVDREYFDE